eukprot:1183076-Rhodomonas_salina.1
MSGTELAYGRSGCSSTTSYAPSSAPWWFSYSRPSSAKSATGRTPYPQYKYQTLYCACGVEAAGVHCGGTTRVHTPQC